MLKLFARVQDADNEQPFTGFERVILATNGNLQRTIRFFVIYVKFTAM